ncbi:MAG: hypothetical protein KA354_17140 [Phycisphaerae bacterium]|nr:hypothetical protein [Phycisphaerae bacterium]
MASPCDRTGFPLLAMPKLGATMHLLPVTKVQFECFLAEPCGFGDEWYEEVLETSPRVSPTRATEADREGLFMAGVIPSEVEAFAQWLGPKWRVPLAKEWRQAYALLRAAPFSSDGLEAWAGSDLNPLAAATLRLLEHQLKPKTWLDLSLMSGALLEWVGSGREWGGLGEPRPQFASYLIDPLRSDPIRPIHRDRRLRDFGMRLWCPL